MSYHESLRLYFKGDREKAARYVNDARRFAYNLLCAINEGGVASGRRRHKLKDGTVITVVVAGLMVSAVIDVEGQGGKKRELDDFVVHARNNGLPNGIDPEHPQQIIRALDEQGSQWKTYWFNTDTMFYEGFGGRKGTYGSLFEDGLTHAGNVDWVSAEGERISWYGPSNRYFFDGYVQPRTQYGKFVFMLGKKLLDTDQYAIDSPEQAHGPERYILGAALKVIGAQTWLYTMQTTASNLSNTVYEVPAFGSVFSAAYSNHDEQVIMCRYRLTMAPDARGVSRYTVDDNSREYVAAVSNLSSEPWVFNTSCTEAVCFENASVDGAGWFCQIADNVFVDPDEVTEVFPSPAQQLIVLQITDDAVTGSTTNLSIRDNGTPVVIARDYVDDEVKEMYLIVEPGVIPYVQLGENRYLLNNCVKDAASYHHNERRYIMFCDLRTEVIVFFRYHSTFLNGDTTNPDFGQGGSVEVWKKGTKLYDTVPDPTMDPVPLVRNMLASEDKYKSLQGKATNPYFYLYGVAFLAYQPDDDISGNQFNMDFMGACNTFGSVPLPALSYFGFYHLPRPEAGPSKLVSERAFPGFSTNRADIDGHYSMLGCVSTDDVIVLSTHSPLWHLSDPNFADRSLTLITGTSMAGVTAVAGALARYHPIWVLGKPAGGDNPPV